MKCRSVLCLIAVIFITASVEEAFAKGRGKGGGGGSARARSGGGGSLLAVTARACQRRSTGDRNTLPKHPTAAIT